jgi:hypothetical protein
MLNPPAISLPQMKQPVFAERDILSPILNASDKYFRSTEEARPGHTAGASWLKGEVVRIWTSFYSNLG